jgi:hypothetical protein
MADGDVKDGVAEVRLPRVILEKLSTFGPATHVVE